ncbi:MAG: restriction endonuclease subunit S, partial [Hyphomonadaceae bacterium]|nr:restriction endonuclease subunit S [Hyphomonadaceae bacterium]
MGELVETNLGELCSFKAGNAFKKDVQGRPKGEYPFIKVSDMNLKGNERYMARAANWVSADDVVANRYTVHEPDSVVFAKIGVALTFNRRRVLKQPTIIDSNMMAAKPNPGRVDPLY